MAISSLGAKSVAHLALLLLVTISVVSPRYCFGLDLGQEIQHAHDNLDDEEPGERHFHAHSHGPGEPEHSHEHSHSGTPSFSGFDFKIMAAETAFEYQLGGFLRMIFPGAGTVVLQNINASIFRPPIA